MQAKIDVGALILRLTVGGLMLFHGIHKIAYGVDGLMEMTRSAGLPGFLVYGVYVGEVVAPCLLIVGLLTRLGAAVIIVDMLAALFIAHIPNQDLQSVVESSGAWAIEPLAFFLLTSVAILVIGPGRLAVDQLFVHRQRRVDHEVVDPADQLI